MKKGTVLATVPRAAWLEASKDESGSPTIPSMVEEMLQELGAGSESDFASFLQQLSGVDLRSHPLMWDDEEVQWVKASPDTYEEVMRERALADERIAEMMPKMLAQTASADVSAEGLRERLRWALCLAEAYGVELEGDGEKIMALCPLLAEIRNTSKAKAANVAFRAGPDALSLVAVRRLRPGQELLQNSAPEASNSWLLAHLGIVPGAELPGVPADLDLIDMNANCGGTIAVPPLTAADFPSRDHMAEKLALLSQYAGVELAAPRLPDLPVSKVGFRLPDEAIGVGRLLPTARFLCSDVRANPAEVQERLAIQFVRFFQHCQLEGGLPPTDLVRSARARGEEQMPEVGYTVDLEMTARRLVAKWCSESVVKLNEAVNAVSTATGLPTGSAEGVIMVGPGQTVMAHFKARRSNGSLGKSRQPRQARVISVEPEAGTVRLEFVANNRRHEVPSSWVVEAQAIPVAGLLSSGISPERLARARLAITLLRTERAVLARMMTTLLESAVAIEELDKLASSFSKTGDEENAKKCLDKIQEFLAQEMFVLDEETAALQPLSLKQLLVDENDGEIVPRWSLPPVTSGFGPTVELGEASP